MEMDDDEIVPLLQQTRPRLLAASPMGFSASPTASSKASEIGTRSTGWLAELMATTAAQADPVPVRISRRRRIYRDAAVVLLIFSIIGLTAFAAVPWLTGNGVVLCDRESDRHPHRDRAHRYAHAHAQPDGEHRRHAVAEPVADRLAESDSITLRP